MFCLENFAPCYASVRTGSLVEFTSSNVCGGGSGLKLVCFFFVIGVVTGGHVTGSIFLFKYKQYQYVSIKMKK